MTKKSNMSSVEVMSASPDATLYWDSRSGVCHDVKPNTFSEPTQHSSFQATGPPATKHHIDYWTTKEIGLAPGFSLEAFPWEQEATLTTFSLDRVLLAGFTHSVPLGTSGELVWAPWPEQPEAFPLSVHPVLLVHTLHESLQARRLMLAPSLLPRDPLHHHIALVLEAALKSTEVAEQLYTASLTDALAAHFLRRYTATRPSLPEMSGGLAPYKLRHTTAYIKGNLEQALSLAQLAIEAQMSPAHFARLFKHATGLAPHQYVLRCRMEQAKRLLAETDLPLSEIALQIGCTDQSHFTALFRKHVALTPKAYRDTTKR
jgi:AraC-like DNA-binding protein